MRSYSKILCGHKKLNDLQGQKYITHSSHKRPMFCLISKANPVTEITHQREQTANSVQATVSFRFSP